MKRFLTVVLALTMILAVSIAAMAANGTWKSYASMGTGSLVSGTQTAQFSTKIVGVQQPLANVSANWTMTGTQAADFTSTVGTGTDASWLIDDASGSAYNKMYITPGSFDNSRGIVMLKLKVNSASGNTNTTFGISAGTKGLQVALRGGTSGAVRIRGGDGTPFTSSDPASFNQTVYRVYAIGWVGSVANVWYSNGTDWTSDVSGWTKIGDNLTMMDESAGSGINGIVLNDGSTCNLYNANIQWIAHSTYDNLAGEMNPWDFDPTLASVPEPGSLLALASGMFGLVGFIARRKRA